VLSAGVRLGPYEIVSPLGAGGMGEVYRARDPRLGREVAIKVLPESMATDRERLRRFEKEVRAAGALNHPHVLTVYDVGIHHGAPYVVMELLEGETLREVIVHRTPAVQQVLTWGMQVAQGLAAAHRKEIVHRDLKPENLFLTTDGRMKILDFGLAKLESRAEAQSGAPTVSNITGPGVRLGTLAYMSPEQACAEGVDQRSDIFSFGVVLYELLAREHPFQRDTVAATLAAILQAKPAELSTRQPGISSGVERIVERCLEKRREERFESAHDLSLAIGAVLQEPSGLPGLLEVPEKSPYPGLSSFTEKNAGNFLGREEEVKALWEKLQRRRLLAVIGPSGAGKTSFVRAGIIASRPDGWAAIVSMPGAAPLRGLGQTLGPELAADSEALRKLAGFEDPETAFELLTRWRRSHDEALIVVDQFEELFTLNASETQVQFATLLGRLAGEAGIHVLVSLRDDFLMRCHDHPALAPVFAELTPLGALSREGLRRAVVEPACKQGYRLEDEALLDEIVSAVEGGRGALPLLAFAVSRLWERRDLERKLLTREAYRKIGGVEGALAQHAEATLEQIGPEHESIVRSIFLNLTTSEGTRAALDREELLSVLPDRGVAESVLRRLVEARLVTSFEVEGGVGESGHRVEILHESLLTTWPRLVRWQTQNADGAQLRDQLRQAAHLWQQRGRTEDLLWTGASYLDYRAWRERCPERLSSVEEDFAKAMAGLATRNVRRRRIAITAIIAALAIGLGAYLLARVQRAEDAARFAFSERAQVLQAAIVGRLKLPVEDLAALSRFLEISGPVTRQQFRLFVDPMLKRHQIVYAFEWLPIVSYSERSTYEREARAAGLPDYRFWEVGHDGKPREAGRRAYYAPIHYMEPPNAVALGFDSAADQPMWDQAARARDSGMIAASPPFRLVEDAGKPDTSLAIAMYAPVYPEGSPASESAQRASLSGFATMIFRVAPLVDRAAGETHSSDLAFVLRDVEAPGAPPLAERPLGATTLVRRTGFELKLPVNFADRGWTLEVFALRTHSSGSDLAATQPPD